jgi:hypothetical protein
LEGICVGEGVRARRRQRWQRGGPGAAAAAFSGPTPIARRTRGPEVCALVTHCAE